MIRFVLFDVFQVVFECGMMQKVMICLIDPTHFKSASQNNLIVVSSLSESFFMVKGAALFLQQGSTTQEPKTPTHHKHAGDHAPGFAQESNFFIAPPLLLFSDLTSLLLLFR